MTETNLDGVIVPRTERSVASRVVGIVKARFSPPAESKMTDAQLAQLRDQRDARERNALGTFRKNLGEVGAQKAIESSDSLSEAAYTEVREATEELLGILNTYRTEGYQGYFHREVKVGYHADDEWVHLPRALPDGSHVVVQYESLHRRRLNPFDRGIHDVSRDEFTHVRVYVIPSDQVDADLTTNNLGSWVSKFAGDPEKDEYYNPMKRHTGVGWSISLDSRDKSEIVPASLTYFSTSETPTTVLNPSEDISEETLSKYRNVGGGRIEYRRSMHLALHRGGGVDVEVWDPRVAMEPVTERYALDGDKLVSPGQRPEEGTPFKEVAHGLVAGLETAVRSATTM